MPLRGWRWTALGLLGKHGGNTARRRLAELERSQWLDPGAMEEYCRTQLARQLSFAARSVPFYQLRYGETESLSDYRPLTRLDLQSGFQELKSPLAHQRGAWKLSSSGSSGQVVTVLRDRQTQAWATACTWRGDCWGAPILPESRQVSLLSNVGNIVGSRRALSPLGTWLHNRYVLDAMRLTPQRVKELLERIAELRPQVLSGYPSVLLPVARIASSHGMLAPVLQKVIPTAESCSPEEAAELEQFFRVPVRQRYGSHEFSAMAHQCEAGRWHWHSEVLWPEVMRPDGSIGQSGRGSLLCTSLVNQSMPLIRYEIGDVVDLEAAACSCGRGLGSFNSIEGRTQEHVYCPDGSWISSHAFLAPLRSLPLLQFQLVQEMPDELLLRVVAQGPLEPRQAEWIQETYRQIHGGAFRLRIEQTDELERSPSGKLLRCINRLKRPELPSSSNSTT